MEQEYIKKITLFAFIKLAPFLILRDNKKGLWVTGDFTCTQDNLEMYSKMGTKMYHLGVVFTLVKFVAFNFQSNVIYKMSSINN
jgi:hypothetical protein